MCQRVNDDDRIAGDDFDLATDVDHYRCDFDQQCAIDDTANDVDIYIDDADGIDLEFNDNFDFDDSHDRSRRRRGTPGQARDVDHINPCGLDYDHYEAKREQQEVLCRHDDDIAADNLDAPDVVDNFDFDVHFDHRGCIDDVRTKHDLDLADNFYDAHDIAPDSVDRQRRTPGQAGHLDHDDDAARELCRRNDDYDNAPGDVEHDRNLDDLAFDHDGASINDFDHVDHDGDDLNELAPDHLFEHVDQHVHQHVDDADRGCRVTSARR